MGGALFKCCELDLIQFLPENCHAVLLHRLFQPQIDGLREGPFKVLVFDLQAPGCCIGALCKLGMNLWLEQAFHDWGEFHVDQHDSGSLKQKQAIGLIVDLKGKIHPSWSCFGHTLLYVELEGDFPVLSIGGGFWTNSIILMSHQLWHIQAGQLQLNQKSHLIVLFVQQSHS